METRTSGLPTITSHPRASSLALRNIWNTAGSLCLSLSPKHRLLFSRYQISLLLSFRTSRTEVLRTETCARGYSLVVQKETKDMPVLEGFAFGHSAGCDIKTQTSLQVSGKSSTTLWGSPGSADRDLFPDLNQLNFISAEMYLFPLQATGPLCNLVRQRSTARIVLFALTLLMFLLEAMKKAW